MDAVIQDTMQLKYKFVIEETTREVNRVLRSWLLNDETRRHFETHSMFRSHLSKYLNVKFGWRHYARSLKQFDPQAIIKDGKLVGISLSGNNYLVSSIDINLRNEFIRAINDFDFTGFNEKWDRDNQEVQLWDLNKKTWEVTNIEAISFNDLENIKF